MYLVGASYTKSGLLLCQLLDWLLGKRHSALLRRAELKTLVDMHGNEVSSDLRICQFTSSDVMHINF